jgi:hypothetical protein
MKTVGGVLQSSQVSLPFMMFPILTTSKEYQKVPVNVSVPDFKKNCAIGDSA